MEIIVILASFASLAAIAGIVYPFKPFGKRRNALFTLVACFVLVGVAVPTPEGSEKVTAPIAATTGSDQTAIATSSPPLTTGQPLRIPNDASAKYFVTNIDKRTDGKLEISTRREGSSGTSLAIRLVQCDPLRFGYIAEGDTEADLVRDPAPQLSELVNGSISDVIAKHACSQQEAPKSALAVLEPTQTEEDANAKKRAEIEEDIKNAVETLRWDNARNRFRTLSNSGLVTDEFSDEIEERMLKRVRPLPTSERETNLKGYQFLAAVRPDKPEYAAKIKSYEDAIKTARQRAVTILRTDEDRIEGITWYKHPNQPKYFNSRSTTYLYIGKKGTAGRPWLRMQVQYTASSWLFVKRVTAWHDGIKEPLIVGRFERDNNSTIWEWMDVTPDAYQIEVLRSLANANEAILRFEGDKYRKDVTLSAGDKKAVREVLAAYEVMRGGLW